jgi:lysophospholipase
MIMPNAFTGAGGREIVWREWPSVGEPRAVVVIAHGFGEHSGRYEHVAERLTSERFHVYAIDHHGHGRSAGPRARISFADAVADLDRLVLLARERHPELALFLLGHSMGGAISLRYAMAHQDRLTGLILSAPLAEVEGRSAAKTAGRLIGAILPALPVTRIDPALVSRDPAVVAAYRSDPLVHHGPIAAGTAAEFVRHVDSLSADVAAIRVPTLILYGTADRLAAPAGARMVAERIGAPDVRIVPYEGLYHEILNEPERDRVLHEIVAWIGERVQAPSGSSSSRAPL